MQPWAARFYASGRWKKCRAGYIKFRRTIDGGLCEECRDKPGYIVHHKRALTPDNITDPDVSPTPTSSSSVRTAMISLTVTESQDL